MIRSLVSLVLLLQTLTSLAPAPHAQTVLAMKTGALLRMHVVAHDDTDEMQRLKLRVRDAVQATYASAPDDGRSMLRRTQDMLPALTRAAREAAVSGGFTGEVLLTVETLRFDQRELDGLTIPAGEYPALMIRMGDAAGHNWWGLIDPELARLCAGGTSRSGWNWSLRAFLHSFFGIRTEVTAHE